MVVTSVAPQVERALLERWQARPGLAGVLVDSGPLGEYAMSFNEWIQIGVRMDPGASITFEQEWDTLGNYRRKETVTIEGLIYVQVEGNGGEQVRASSERAFELLAEVEDALRETPAAVNLDGLVLHIQLQSGTAHRYAATETRNTMIPFQVTYEASLLLT